MEHPKTEEEFQRLMEDIEIRFQKDNIPLPHRPLKAVELIASELGLVLPLTSPSLMPTPGVFHGDSMSAHIYHWSLLQKAHWSSGSRCYRPNRRRECSASRERRKPVEEYFPCQA